MPDNTKASKISLHIPSLSVVVVTVYESSHLVNCLDALERQNGAPDMETIVVCHENILDISSLRERFPSVQFHRLLGRQTQDMLRAYGVSRARGKIVAVTVDHCTPEENWCAHIMKAHQGSNAAVGGAIEKGIQPDTLVNWAVHLYDYSNYGYYLNPTSNGPARDLSDCNVSYKREALAAVSNLWKKAFNVSLLNRTLKARGETLWLSPDILVYQNRNIDFDRAARIACRRGRAFASARLASLTRNQRLVYAALSPLLPLLLMRRFVLNIIRKKSHLGNALRALPCIIVFAILWSWGEFRGYFTGQLNFTVAASEE